MNGNPAPQDDAALIRDCRKGADGAFAALYDTYRDGAYSLAYYLTGDADAAEEITQRAFVRVYRSLDRFREDARFSTWLHRIVSNLCIDERRKRKRSRFVSLDVDRANRIPAGDESDRDVIARERAAVLADALARLGEDMRRAIVMKYIGGMSYEEIAAACACSSGTVGSRISRGLKQLGEELEHLKDNV